ncbi:MAG: BMC domain-containing protein [Veillonellales bacterium]
MQHAVGVIEMKNIAKAYLVADTCLKSAAITLHAKTMCPGKFLIIVSGEISSVKSSVEAGCALARNDITDSIILGNIDQNVLRGMMGTAAVKEYGAIGVIETFTVPAAIKAADMAVKTAQVDVMDVRTAQGLGGKGIVYITGSIGAVQMAVDAVSKDIAAEGVLVDAVVVSSPDKQLLSLI